MTTTFKVGDVVRYKASFLRNVGWHTDVPDNGVVTNVSSDKLVAVQWPDTPQSVMVINSNLILKSESHLEPV